MPKVDRLTYTWISIGTVSVGRRRGLQTLDEREGGAFGMRWLLDGWMVGWPKVDRLTYTWISILQWSAADVTSMGSRSDSVFLDMKGCFQLLSLLGLEKS